MRAVGAEPVWAVARVQHDPGSARARRSGPPARCRARRRRGVLCSGPRRRPTQHDRTAGDRSGGPVRWSSMVLSDGAGDGCARPAGGRLLTPRDGVRFPAAGERRRGLSAPGCDDIADGTTPATGVQASASPPRNAHWDTGSVAQRGGDRCRRPARSGLGTLRGILADPACRPGTAGGRGSPSTPRRVGRRGGAGRSRPSPTISSNSARSHSSTRQTNAQNWASTAWEPSAASASTLAAHMPTTILGYPPNSSNVYQLM